jgi:hypothetical protein
MTPVYIVSAALLNVSVAETAAVVDDKFDTTRTPPETVVAPV